MDYTVIWTEHALEDLADAVRYIAADDPQRPRDSVIRSLSQCEDSVHYPTSVRGMNPLAIAGFEKSFARRIASFIEPSIRARLLKSSPFGMAPAWNRSFE